MDRGPLALLCVLLASVTTSEAKTAALDEAAYPLDQMPRVISPKGKVKCPEVPLIRYGGDVVRLARPSMVYVGFQQHLRRFEEIVRDTAIEIYGRAPRRIRHLGTFNCRRIRRWPTFLSEHAIGNAIDVEAFEFGPARGQQREMIPRRLRRRFTVSVERHWKARRGVGKRHARFLRLLAERVIDEDELFRVILGPAEPGHHNHFHFDMSPWRIVNVFEPEH